LALVLAGAITFTIGGKLVPATTGSVVRLPAGIPHGVDTGEAARMLLIMLRDIKAA
jgi:quercetin dioxygenase-like cupin family protein